MPRRRLPAALCLLLLLPLGCGDGKPASEEDRDERLDVQSKPETYKYVSVGPTLLRFADASAEGGIDAVNHSGRSGVKEYLLEAVGTGPSVLDYDHDGLMDVYVPDGDVLSNYLLRRAADPETREIKAYLEAKEPRPEAFRDQLWRNLGNGRFEDVAAKAGIVEESWSFGSTAFDYDGDGWTDIFVANFGRNRLWRNNGDGTFTDIAPGVGLEGSAKEWSNCGAVADIDGDGRLDMYVANFADPAAEIERMRLEHNQPEDEPVEAISGRYCRWRGLKAYCGPVGLVGVDDHMYVQQADGRFRDVTKEVGAVPRTPRYGFTVIAIDFNDDGLMDFYVANDSVENFMWQQFREDGKIVFRETSDTLGVKFARNLRPQASMGADTGDFDQDGNLDLFVTTFSHDYNNIYLGQRSAADPKSGYFFRDRGLQVMGQQVYYDLAWGCGWWDFDNDADLDLYVANGHVYKEIDLFEKTGARYEQLNALFECLDAPQLTYREVGKKAQEGAPEGVPIQNLDAGPGMAVARCSRGATFLDYDNDGRMDVLVQNMNTTPTLLRNESPSQGHWVKLVLEQPGQNRNALGAVIEVTADGRTQKFPIVAVRSFLGSDDPRLHVGIGAADTCDVKVTWPGKTAETTFRGVGANGLWSLDRETGEATRLPLPTFR